MQDRANIITHDNLQFLPVSRLMAVSYSEWLANYLFSPAMSLIRMESIMQSNGLEAKMFWSTEPTTWPTGSRWISALVTAITKALILQQHVLHLQEVTTNLENTIIEAKHPSQPWTNCTPVDSSRFNISTCVQQQLAA
jgi:hypothetical protein